MDSLLVSIKVLKRHIGRLKHGIHLETESDEVSLQRGGVISSEVIEHHENVEDVSGELVDHVQITQDISHPMTDNALSMSGFMERPVQVAAATIALNSDIDFTYNIWNLFLANPTIRAKLRNFAFLRCNLNVKITVSGTPFHYGKLLVSYQPFPSVNQNLTIFATRRAARLRYLSQAYGARTIDVRENKPFELEVPYVSPLPIGRLYNDATVALSAASNFDDFSGLGTLYISTLNQVKAVNATATNIFMYVYVYASDVYLAGTTGTVNTITTESDEREIGPVEKLSSSLLPISQALEKVPSIGIFAKASSMALGALSKVSALFGWSYPTLIGSPVRMRPDPWQNGAHTIGVDTGKRITLDPKQELSVDPRIVGVDEDELAISSICKNESLLDTFTWLPGSVPLNSIVWSAAVTPRASVVDLIPATPQYIATVPTALGFAATPFEYWRGKIIYRFEIVASNFHRGKLMFFYEPNIRQNSLINAALNMNKQHVRIVDIQETQVVEFCVDWNFPRPWCRNVDDPGVTTTIGSQFQNTPGKFETCNGVICVTPFTALQSPDGSSIQVNVYVHSPDMAFNRMTSVNMPVSFVPYTQSDEKWISNKDSTCMDIAPPIMSTVGLSENYFGEKPVSFRSLLKRFQQGNIFKVAASASCTLRAYNCSAFPPPTITSTVNNAGTIGNLSGSRLYSYIRNAYLGQRGGVRYRVRYTRATAAQGDFRVVVRLQPDSFTQAPVNHTSGGTDAQALIDMDGCVMYLTTVNGGIEFEVPFYSNNSFLWACNPDPYFATGLSVLNTKGLRNFLCYLEGFESAEVTANTSFAMGEDFTFFRWLGAGPVRLNATAIG